MKNEKLINQGLPSIGVKGTFLPERICGTRYFLFDGFDL